MSYLGNAPVFPTESVLPGNLQVTGNATISGSSATVNGDEVRTLGTSGAIVQVVQGSTGTQVRTGGNTLIDTGLSATITPTSTSNKILVIVQQSGCHKDSSNTYGTLRLYRGSSHVVTWEGQFGYNGANTANSVGTCGGQWLDSPATTSATTYKTMFSSVNNNNWVYVQVASDNSTITLIEVVA